LASCQQVLNQTAKNNESTHLDKEMDDTVLETALSFSFCCQERELNDNSNNTSGERKSVDRQQFGGDFQFVLERVSR
jgi:hypothetical protein